jgi:rhodanese-related sulfurtransferase
MVTATKLQNPQKAKEFFEDKINFSTGPVEVFQQIQEKSQNTEDFVVIDVRAEKDYREAHVPGALNLPKNKWYTLQGLDKEKNNILYCYSQTCHLAAKAAVEFASRGFSVMEMDGGFKAWKESNLQVEK